MFSALIATPSSATTVSNAGSFVALPVAGLTELTMPRAEAVAAPLLDGDVMIAGGQSAGDAVTAEQFDGASETFSALPGRLDTGRMDAAAATLRNGDVLIAGGRNPADFQYPLTSAELYNPATESFTPLAAPMNVPRAGASAATLPDGDVLIAGGTDDSDRLSSAELFDPSTGSFTLLAAPMTVAREGAAAATLPDGFVLIAGGAANGTPPSAELFNPTTGTFSALSSQYSGPGGDASAATLSNGDVLIAGGYDSTAAIYDPATASFSATGPLNQARDDPVVAPLPNGDALVAGGSDQAGDELQSAEIYEPATNTFQLLTRRDDGQLTTSRSNAASAALADGQVLIAGGWGSSGTALESAELFDPSTDTFIAIPNPMTTPRADAAAALLPDGDVLIVGGLSSGSGTPLQSAEIFDPTTQTFSALSASMTVPRAGAAAASLPDGDVLIAGGYPESSMQSAELFEPATNTFTAVSQSLVSPRTHPEAVTLPDGDVLIVGGVDCDVGGVPSAEIFDSQTSTFSALRTAIPDGLSAAVALLSNGEVLVAGGFECISGAPSEAPQSASILDPTTGEVSALPSTSSGELEESRIGAIAATLSSGDVLIAGGSSSFDQTAELFVPAPDLTASGGDFGVQPIGTSARSTVTLENVGPAPVSIVATTLGGNDPSDFALTADGCSGQTLDYGQSCPLTVSFTPAAAGSLDAALVATDSELGTSTIVISGTTQSSTPASSGAGSGGWASAPGASTATSLANTTPTAAPPAVAASPPTPYLEVLTCKTLGKRGTAGEPVMACTGRIEHASPPAKAVRTGQLKAAKKRPCPAYVVSSSKLVIVLANSKGLARGLYTLTLPRVGKRISAVREVIVVESHASARPD